MDAFGTPATRKFFDAGWWCLNVQMGGGWKSKRAEVLNVLLALVHALVSKRVLFAERKTVLAQPEIVCGCGACPDCRRMVLVRALVGAWSKSSTAGVDPPHRVQQLCGLQWHLDDVSVKQELDMEEKDVHGLCCDWMVLKNAIGWVHPGYIVLCRGIKCPKLSI